MWRKGEKSALARLAGISPSKITVYTHRHQRPNAVTAQKLATACAAMALPIKRDDWAYCMETVNPYFEGAARV